MVFFHSGTIQTVLAMFAVIFGVVRKTHVTVETDQAAITAVVTAPRTGVIIIILIIANSADTAGSAAFLTMIIMGCAAIRGAVTFTAMHTVKFVIDGTILTKRIMIP